MVATNSANHHATLLSHSVAGEPCAIKRHGSASPRSVGRRGGGGGRAAGRRPGKVGRAGGRPRLRLQLPGVDAQPGRARQTEAARAAMRLGQLERRPRGTRYRHLRSSSYTEHSLFHAHVPLSRRQELCCRRTACVEQCLPATIRQITSYGRFRQHLKTHFYSGPRNRSAL